MILVSVRSFCQTMQMVHDLFPTVLEVDIITTTATYKELLISCGNATFLFKRCHLHSMSERGGAVTVQHSVSFKENTGFTFLGCKITGGDGAALLGNPRVLTPGDLCFDLYVQCNHAMWMGSLDACCWSMKVILNAMERGLNAPEYCSCQQNPVQIFRGSYLGHNATVLHLKIIPTCFRIWAESHKLQIQIQYLLMFLKANGCAYNIDFWTKCQIHRIQCDMAGASRGDKHDTYFNST